MKVVLLSVVIMFAFFGCARTAMPNNIAGKFYMAGDSNCVRYRQLSPTRILCIDANGAETGYRDAMTDQELQMYMHNQNINRASRKSNSYKQTVKCTRFGDIGVDAKIYEFDSVICPFGYTEF